ncbi:hypothetical protein ACWE42_03210 [Sutcliffiella cohnii]|uniref:hypothetical protein n=1 Tax=Sutcliffiella TaxID=2837511 RepID=UPI000AFCA709|nr:MULTISPECIES: hypothetical protein [Sutcliffiella]MED4018622.1 hypothetical protein [Sutcliffiella cohnii]WBL13035.1 hypothetical protein O1A01_13935 [Sutcliffiella sp. NC1]
MEVNEIIAYTTIAMERLGYSREEIENVTNEILVEVKKYSVQTAEQLADAIIFNEEELK